MGPMLAPWILLSGALSQANGSIYIESYAARDIAVSSILPGSHAAAIEICSNRDVSLEVDLRLKMFYS